MAGRCGSADRRENSIGIRLAGRSFQTVIQVVGVLEERSVARRAAASCTAAWRRRSLALVESIVGSPCRHSGFAKMMLTWRTGQAAVCVGACHSGSH